jgi:uncharacterized protein (AIM24 family)
LKFDIKYKPSYAMLVASLNQGETITAEAGAMTYMDPTIEVHTRKQQDPETPRLLLHQSATLKNLTLHQAKAT